MKIALLLDGEIRNDGRVRRITESLSEFHQVDLFCVRSTFDDQGLFNKNVRVFHYDLTLSWINVNLRLDQKFDTLFSLVLQYNKTYDLIYVNDYPLLSTGVKLKQVIGGKLIYDSHEIYIATMNQFFPQKGWKSLYGKPLTWWNQWFHKQRERKHLIQVDQMITVCDSFKTYFETTYDAPPILVVKNCPKEVGEYSQTNLLREKLNLSDQDKILLYQGDVNISRGIEITANALQFLTDDIHFVVLGGGTKLNEFKEKYTQSNIHFYGKVPFEELYDYTRSADLCIMLIENYNLSKKLTLPNKAFEYMVAGKPYITNQLPEVSKIVKEENCGFVIDDSTPESTASAIQNAFKHQNLDELGRNGYTAVLTKYNWENEVKKLLDYVRTVQFSHQKNTK